MSPALWLLLTFGAGLATGLARFWNPLGVTLVLLAAVAWFHRRAGALWGMVALCGLASGVLARSREAGRCAVTLPVGPVEVEVRVVEPVFPDQPLAGIRLPGQGCTGAVTARWPSQEVPAGTEGRATGRWIRREELGGRVSGILVIRTFAARGLMPTRTERFQTWLGVRTRQLFGARAGSVEALLLSRRGGMTLELRDRYARAGLVHILSISGFHVGVVVAWVVLLARLLTPRREVAALAGVLVALGYVAFIGWPPPAARAALLALLVAQARWRQRHLLPLPLLALTGEVVLLLDPWAVFDPGAWLSVAALTGALVATRWSDRRLGPTWWWRMLAGSVGATVATAPVTAGLFGTVSLAGVVLNFAAVPLAAVTVPGLIAALGASWLWPGLGASLAAGSGSALALLDQIAWWGGAWDGSVVYQPTGLPSALPWIAVLLALWWSIADGARRAVALRRSLLALTGGVWILAGIEQARAVRATAGGLALHFLDVGQGDAALVRTPHGRWVLIDAGPRSERQDAGRRVVAPFLARQRAPGVALAVISHAHADHLGGMPAVLERFPVGGVLEPAELVADSLYVEFLDRLEAEAVPWRNARDGIQFEIDSVRFRLLHPDPAWREWQLDLNEDSAILLLEYGGFRALFAGDAGHTAEARIRGRVGRLSLLKVGHHGSRSATGEDWLAELRPAVAVISSGAGNRYGHPHPEVLERLARHRIGVWRTDQQGTISLVTDGRRMTVSGRSQQASFPVMDEP